jgi:hypothetical protein
MRVFFGIILGIVITLGAAYFHDSGIPVAAATPAPLPTDPSPSVPVGPADLTQRRIVNWDVLEAIADQGTTFVRDQWNKIFQ